MPDVTPVILWFRQDLRLADNPALHHALETGRPIIPVFVLDQETPGHWAIGGAGLWWLHHSLASLQASLTKLGQALILRRGAWETVLPELLRETGAAAVYANQPHEPWARAADARLAKALQGTGAALHLFRALSLFPLDTIRTQSGGVYGVYGAFRRACLAGTPPAPPLPAPKIWPRAKSPHSDRLEDWRLLPRHPDWAGGLREHWQAGEQAAQTRLKHFLLEILNGYDSSRERPAEAGTSSLSPHLHWGEISPAQAWHAAAQAQPEAGSGLERFQNELIWRDFAAYLLHHHPSLPEQPMRADFARLGWRRAKGDLRAWQRGRTGVPIVDAGMRQLWHTGWMHNRVRMVAASFLIKHLLIPWQDGERWFWDTLVDADLATNAVSWQWVAGTGADPQPFFRVFNPVLQGRKFDPDGTYVRHWCPELARLPSRFIHAPWEARADILEEAGVTIGKTYPRPVVDLAAGRQRALDAFRKIGRQRAA